LPREISEWPILRSPNITPWTASALRHCGRLLSEGTQFGNETPVLTRALTHDQLLRSVNFNLAICCRSDYRVKIVMEPRPEMRNVIHYIQSRRLRKLEVVGADNDSGLLQSEFQDPWREEAKEHTRACYLHLR